MHVDICPNLNFAKAIGNLHRQSRAKVSCHIDRTVITGGVVANLSLNLSALIMTHINFQTLVQEATVTGNKGCSYHAALKDLHTTAELTLDKIWQMVDEMLEAHYGRVLELR